MREDLLETPLRGRNGFLLQAIAKLRSIKLDLSFKENVNKLWRNSSNHTLYQDRDTVIQCMERK